MGGRQSKKSYEVGKVETLSGIKSSTGFKKKGASPQPPKNVNVLSEGSNREVPAISNGIESIQEEEEKILEGIRIAPSVNREVNSENSKERKITEEKPKNDTTEKKCKDGDVNKKKQSTESQIPEDESKMEKELLPNEIKAVDEVPEDKSKMEKESLLNEIKAVDEVNAVSQNLENVHGGEDTQATLSAENKLADNVEGEVKVTELIAAAEAISEVSEAATKVDSELVRTTDADAIENVRVDCRGKNNVDDVIIIQNANALEELKKVEGNPAVIEETALKMEAVLKPQQFETRATIENASQETKIKQPSTENINKTKQLINHGEKVEVIEQKQLTQEEPKVTTVAHVENKEQEQYDHKGKVKDKNLETILNIEKEVNAIESKILHFNGLSTDNDYITFNETLMRFILTLDEITVETDEIREERRRVIKYLQNCIKILQENVQIDKNDNEFK